MDVIRTFVAVLISDDLKKRIFEAQELLRKLAPDVKWVAPECFHVTMKFLGDVRREQLPLVYSAVEDAASSFRPFDVSISGLGAFPSPSRARVVWARIDEGREQLARLAASIEESLAGLGFEREDKSFKAHITIGRVKMSRSLDALAAGIGKIDAADLGRQRVTGVTVMKSDLQRQGPVYSPLKVIEFKV